MKIFNRKSKALYITLAALLVLMTGTFGSLTGCTINITDPYVDYTANAVNIKTANITDGFYKDSSLGITLVGTTISLYAYNSTTGAYSSTAAATATVGAGGSFTFTAPEPNRYKLTAIAADWIFIPQYIEITNNGALAKDLYAYPKDGAGEYTIIASWENEQIDVDLTLTYGDEAASATSPWTSGDTTADTDRLRIYYNGRGSTDGTGISLDMDVSPDDPASVSRVETISLHDASWLYNGDTIKIYLDTPVSGDVLTGLEASTPYPSAYAQVDMMYYNSSTDTSEHYGTWFIPWNTAETTIQVMQIVYTYNPPTDNGTYTISSANNAATLYSDDVAYPYNIKAITRKE